MQLNLGARENECLNTARERERAWQSMKNVSKQITSFECWSTETIELYTVAPVCRLFGLSDMRMQWSTKSSVDNAFKCYHYEYFKDGNTQVVRANNGTRSNLIISRGYSWSDDGVIHELYKTVLGKSVRRQKKKTWKQAATLPSWWNASQATWFFKLKWKKCLFRMRDRTPPRDYAVCIVSRPAALSHSGCCCWYSVDQRRHCKKLKCHR